MACHGVGHHPDGQHESGSNGKIGIRRLRQVKMTSRKKASTRIGHGGLRLATTIHGGSGRIQVNYLMAELYLEMTMDKNIVWKNVNDLINDPKEMKEQEPLPCHLRHRRHRD